MNITIRTYQKKDLDSIKELFYNTVHQVNQKDYSSEELIAWAPELDNKQIDWVKRINPINCFVALVDHDLVGFSTIDEKGFIDFLYVHHNFQRIGIASYLYTRMELEAEEDEIKELSTFASITARPFFEKMGFSVTKENIVDRGGQKLKNYLMKKLI